MNRIKISKDFSLHEFQCKDGSGLVKVDSGLLDKLQQLRDRLGLPMTINSAYRTPEHNKKVSGATNSQHLLGKAVDISILNQKLDIETIRDLADAIGFTGIGIYDTFIHLDVRDTPNKWDLRTKKGPDTMKKGSRGNDVKDLQNRLNELSYNVGVADGIFGSATDREVKRFQKDNKLTIDGVVGKNTLAILNAKKKLNFKHYKSGVTDVIEIDPLELKVSIQDKAANKISLGNFVTSCYQWHHANGITYPLGILVSQGKVISNTQPHGKPAGTLIVYKDGSVKVKELLNINTEKDVWFAVSGCSVLPKINMISAGFVGAYSDIGRSANRPLIGFNPTKGKIVIAVRKNCSIQTGQTVLKNLGCTIGITLDAGGSTALDLEFGTIYSTTRRLYSVITW